ncbi:MAG: DUF554 domain-containing protein [Spirochaetes bacterium]|nr:DUF554 domain-containing protein [Spirochaetota bacterium]
MTGVLVNTAAIIAGSIIGLIFRKGIPQKYTDSVMTGIGLCTVYIGISGTLKGQNSLVLIFSIVSGAFIGTWIDIDERMNRLGENISGHFKKASGSSVALSEGFVAASLLFCVGAMSIVGSLNAGLSGDNEMLFTKSVLDFTAAAMMSVSLGIGILFSAVTVFAYEGSIVLLSRFLQPFLTETAVSEITCTGSLLILALGLNITGITKIKVANYLPAIFIVPVLCYIMTFFS